MLLTILVFAALAVGAVVLKLAAVLLQPPTAQAQ